MAPIRSRMKRTATRTRSDAVASTRLDHLKGHSSTANDSITNNNNGNKKNKRLSKHASFVSRIEKTSQKPKRRRSSTSKKKLIASMDSLADALPETDAIEQNPSASHVNVNVIKRKTLRHKPGARKQKEKLEKLERDRFAKNMAQLTSMRPPTEPANTTTSSSTAATPTTTYIDGHMSTEPNQTSNRWAALRNFIFQTVEQQPAFKTGS